MPTLDQPPASLSDDDDLVLVAHRFSNQALSLAKAFVAEGADREAIKAQARDHQARLPALGARLAEAPPEARPDLNRVLADARLDLSYILSDGKLPTSTRLHFHLTDLARG